jgi:hypothetical protein
MSAPLVEVRVGDLVTAMQAKADQLDKEFRDACAADGVDRCRLRRLGAMWAKLTGTWPNTHRAVDDRIGLLLEDLTEWQMVSLLMGPSTRAQVSRELVVELTEHWPVSLP